jgi:hypothetical protein
MVREAETKSQISGNLQSGSPLTLQQITGAGLKSLSDSSVTHINAKLAMIPIAERDISDVTQLVTLFSVVEKLGASQRFNISDLVQAGFVPVLDPDRASIMRSLKSLSAEERNTPEKIEEVIAATKKKIADRKVLLQAVLARKKLNSRS